MTPSLRFAPGHFYGGTRLSFSSHEINVTHRIADRLPEEVASHTHTDSHFVLVTGGDYVTIADGNPAKGLPVLVYNPAGTTHRDHFERGRGSFFAISLEPAKASALPAGCLLPDGPIHLLAPAQHALAFRIAAFSKSQDGGSSLDALVHELLGTMDRQAHQPARSPPAWLHRALELLHDRYVEDLSIADIAASVGIHPIHLARSFRSHFRCTPGAFGRFRRLDMATQLLSRSARPLAEVALNCGFADQSHFSKVFARHLGLAPGEYRRLVGIRGNRSPMFQIDKSGPPGLVKLRARGAMAREYARKYR
jgi:AraC family transcriptional regulator